MTIREWQDSLPDTKIETKAGALWVCVNGPGTLAVNSKPIYGANDVGAYLTIRGVEYYTSAHMIYMPSDVRAAEGTDDAGEIRVRKGWRVAPGTHQRGAETLQNWNWRQGLHASRKGSFSDRETSDAARRTLTEIIETAVNEWATSPDAPEKIRQGVIRCLSNDARSAEEKLAEKLAEVGTLRAKVRELDKQIAKLSHAR